MEQDLDIKKPKEFSEKVSNKSPKKLSEKAWSLSKSVIQAIKNHPFNQELMKGTLARDKFAYYIEQDTLYLQDFARCHALLASKASLEDMKSFLTYSNQSLIVEQEGCA